MPFSGAESSGKSENFFKQIVLIVEVGMMNESAINCWEFKECGREPGGINVSGLGICPVAIEHEVDGIHGGKNGGRCCWIFSGFFSCGTEDLKNFEEKISVCSTCNFYTFAKDSKELLVLV